MALSGAINGTFSGAPTNQVYPRLEWSATQSIAGNSSTVTVILYFMRPSSAWQSWNANGHTCTIAIHTNSASANRTFDIRNTSKQEIWRRTVTMEHSDAGNLTMGISASGSTGLMLGSYSVGGSITLDQIPRAYSFIVSETTHEMDTPLTVKINNNGSGFSAKLRINFGGKEVYYTVGNIGSDFYITPKASDFAPVIPNANSGWGGIHLDTYNGSTKIGTYSVSPFTMTVPASVKPTVKSVTITDPLSGVPAKLGIENTVNLFVRKYSNIRLDVRANESYSSPIKSWAFSCDGKAILTNNGPINDIPLSQYDIGVGAKVIKCVMTDARGRSVSKDITVNIQDYAAPALTNLSAERVDGGTTVKFTKGGKVYSIKNGTTELNPYTTVTKYKLTTATDWTVGKTENNACATFTIGTFATDKSYDILIEIKDKLKTRQYTYVISTAKVLFDLYKNEGIGVGKMREKGSLDVAGDVYIDNRKLIDIFYPVGAIFQSTNSASPSTFMGGTWERYAHGRVLVGVFESDSDFSTANKNGGSKTTDMKINKSVPRYGASQGSGAYAGRLLITGSGIPSNSNSSMEEIMPYPSIVQQYTTVYIWRRTA